jgi:sulfoxide reductase heme-binding subunit YedZ
MARPLPWLNPAVIAGAAVPAGLIAVRAGAGELGANPIATALNQLGLLALVFLLASLACTPLQLLFKWTWPVRIRRTLGLIAFTYVTVHFLTYLCLDLQLDFASLGKDLAKRPFITVGFAAWLLLIPLALTSTDHMVRRLGFVRWKRLHRLAYLCGGLGALHFWWRVKKDVTEPTIYACILATLLLVRVVKRNRTPVQARQA